MNVVLLLVILFDPPWHSSAPR